MERPAVFISKSQEHRRQFSFRLWLRAGIHISPITLNQVTDTWAGISSSPKTKRRTASHFLKRPPGLSATAIHHLAVSGQILASGGKVCNCLIHPSVRQAVHGRYEKAMQGELSWCLNHIDDEFRTELHNAYDELHPEKSSKADFEAVFAAAKNLLESHAVKVLVMNGKHDVDSSEYSSGSNIVIGGNTLGRGVTFPSLHTIYYTRTSKKPQADTMWQRQPNVWL